MECCSKRPWVRIMIRMIVHVLTGFLLPIIGMDAGYSRQSQVQTPKSGGGYTPPRAHSAPKRSIRLPWAFKSVAIYTKAGPSEFKLAAT